MTELLESEPVRMVMFGDDEPPTCHKCERVYSYDSTIDGRCRLSYCIKVLCPHCQAELASFGPVGCPACSPGAVPGITELRQAYRRRRGMRRFR